MSVKVSDLIRTYEDSTSSGDFSDWCDKLELVAGLQKITDLSSFMPLFLGGAAFAVYKQLSSEVKKDYVKVKDELLTAFSENCFNAYEQFRTRTLVEGETVDFFLADLRRLAKLMGQEQAGPMLRCAFVAGLPTDVASQIKSVLAVEKLSLTDIVTRARMILSTHAGHATVAAGAASQRSTTRCYNCQSSEHRVKECPLNRGKSNKRQVRCYTCNQFGHISRHCSQGQGNGSGEAASAPDASLNN